MRLDRRLLSANTFPADYGYVPDTVGPGGDPLDALVILEDGTFPGCRIEVRVIGVFWVKIADHTESKIVGVPANDPVWGVAEELDDLPGHLITELEHFFDVYKDLEPGSDATPAGHGGRQRALKELGAAQQAFDDNG